MIRYALQCVAGHPFEGWFGSSDDYDDQAARGLLTCPLCASSDISKQIMAPNVVGARKGATAVSTREAINQFRAYVEENFENVGEDFADEALAIHEGRAEERGILGEASLDEAVELLKAGVSVAPLPPKLSSKRDLN